MDNVFIALMFVCVLSFVFDISTMNRDDMFNRVLNFFATPIAALMVAVLYYFRHWSS